MQHRQHGARLQRAHTLPNTYQHFFNTQLLITLFGKSNVFLYLCNGVLRIPNGIVLPYVL